MYDLFIELWRDLSRRGLMCNRHWLPVLALAVGLSACGTDVGTGTRASPSLSTATQPASVTAGASVAAPTITIKSDPSIVSAGGGTTLTWSSTNATSCTASGAWSGSEPISGTQTTGALSADMTYTLTCTGSGGSTQQSTTVTINVPTGLTCTGVSGPLSLKASAVRSSGVSPLLVFFDATGTTDTSIAANTTAFQNVTYTWNFGDTGTSGTEAWAYGSNAGHNNKNTATGGVAAHLYVTPGVDTAYTATVTATDGTNTASCQLGVTAYDPAGANGFPTTATTCVSSSGMPVAGSGGCPAGAAVLKSSSMSSINTSMNGKQVLFKCGDTFSGGATVGGTKFSIGAYGGCQGTSTDRPIFHSPLSVGSGTVADGRVADIDFESTGSYAVATTSGTPNGPMTLYNLNSNGNNTSYYWAQGTQWGLIQSVMTGMGTEIGVYVNYAENNCANGSRVLNCGQTTPVYNNIDYQAVLGNSFNGTGAPNNGSGIEVLRVSACRMCVIENNTNENANNIGATLKLHNGNTFDSAPTWIGQYTELVEISDNLFTGTSGAQLVENAPQNSLYDERLRNIVVERNLFQGTDTGGGRQILVSAVNETLRDNVFNQSVAGGGQGIQIAQRGIEPVPQFVQVYNNTCYAGTCAAFSGDNFAAPGINSSAENNLCYLGTCISNGGSSNTASNNTGTTSNNPGFTNASGTLSLISDFKPTENYTGATSVPVWYDALGTAWAPTWNLGAVHH